MKIFCTDFPLLTGGSLADSDLRERLYMRGDNTLINSGKRVMITSWMRGLSYMPQLVVRIDRAGKGFAPRFADRYYHQAAWALALADREQVVERLERRLDPALAFSFDGSLGVGRFLPLEQLRDEQVALLETVGAEPIEESLPSLTLPTAEQIDGTISGLAQLFLLKTGDYVCFPLWDHYRPLRVRQQLFVAEGDVELLNIGIE